MSSRLAFAAIFVIGLGACGSSSSSGTDGGAGGGGGGAGANTGAADAGSGGSGGATDGSVPCSPCYATVVALVQPCIPPATATCVEQRSNTTSGGVETIVDNKCFSNGSKTLATTTVPLVDGGTSMSPATESGQVTANGTLCATFTLTTQVISSGSGTITETIMNPAGQVVATLGATVTTNADGTQTQTSTISCPGQQTQPLGDCASTGPSTSCDAGTCM
jgi:hypothetical protein